MTWPPRARLAELTAQPVLKKRGVKRKAEEVRTEDRRLQGTGLRHFVHSRIVMRDICLPFTDFTSSKQLVRMVLECIVGTSQLPMIFYY